MISLCTSKRTQTLEGSHSWSLSSFLLAVHRSKQPKARPLTAWEARILWQRQCYSSTVAYYQLVWRCDSQWWWLLLDISRYYRSLRKEQVSCGYRCASTSIETLIWTGVSEWPLGTAPGMRKSLTGAQSFGLTQSAWPSKRRLQHSGYRYREKPRSWCLQSLWSHLGATPSASTWIHTVSLKDLASKLCCWSLL